jgi:hypothetical protein
MQGFLRTDQLGRVTRTVSTGDELESNPVETFIHTPTEESRKRNRESTWAPGDFRV